MTDAVIWSVIVVLGVGTWLIRFSFIGIIGDRELPAIVMRLLRYVPVAVLPAIVAPLVAWPDATGGVPDPARIIAAAAVLVAGALWRNVLGSILIGMAALYLMLWLTS